MFSSCGILLSIESSSLASYSERKLVRPGDGYESPGWQVSMEEEPKLSIKDFVSSPAYVSRDFPFTIAWNHPRLGMLPIVTACAPPVSSASEFSPFSYSPSQFMSFYLLDSRFSSSLAGLRVLHAQTFLPTSSILPPQAPTRCTERPPVAATLVVQYGRGLRRTTSV